MVGPGVHSGSSAGGAGAGAAVGGGGGGVGDGSTAAGAWVACSCAGGGALLVAGTAGSVVEGAGVVVDGGVVVTGAVVVVVAGASVSSSFPNTAPQPPHKQIAATIAPTAMRVLRLVRLRRSTFAACGS